MKALKVYGWTSFYPPGFGPPGRQRNCRCFVAAASKAEVYRLTGKKPHDFYEVVESGNEQELEVALGEPGVVFIWDAVNYAPRDRKAVRLEGPKVLT